MKTEMEVAMKLLEKDIHEKQNTIISLRKQLEEIKLINLEMFKKLQVRIICICYRRLAGRASGWDGHGIVTVWHTGGDSFRFCLTKL